MIVPLLWQRTTQTFDLAGGGRIVLHRRGLSPMQAHGALENALAFHAWRKAAPWQPRLTAWCGDVGASYVYSGIVNDPQPWPMWLEDLRARIVDATGALYNSCLGNLYRDGRDSVALHADDEPELGPEPTIASLSLGASRKFQLRHATAAPIDLMLDDGDLLVMSGPMQREWKHGVPKMARVDGPRVNLTFRWVEAR